MCIFACRRGVGMHTHIYTLKVLGCIISACNFGRVDFRLLGVRNACKVKNAFGVLVLQWMLQLCG